MSKPSRILVAVLAFACLWSCSTKDSREKARYATVLKELADALRKDDFSKAAGYCTLVPEKAVIQNSGPFGLAQPVQIATAGYVVTDPPGQEADLIEAAARNGCGLDADSLKFDDIVYVKRKGDRVLLKAIVRGTRLGVSESAETHFGFVDNGKKASLVVKLMSLGEKTCLYVFNGFHESSIGGGLILNAGESFWAIKDLDIRDWLENGWSIPAGAEKIDHERKQKGKGHGPAVAALAAAPAYLTFGEIGQTARIRVTAKDDSGKAIPAPELHWTVADPDVADIHDGTATAKKAGVTNITIESGRAVVEVPVSVAPQKSR